MTFAARPRDVRDREHARVIHLAGDTTDRGEAGAAARLQVPASDAAEVWYEFCCAVRPRSRASRPAAATQWWPSSAAATACPVLDAPGSISRAPRRGVHDLHRRRARRCPHRPHVLGHTDPLKLTGPEFSA